MPNRLPSINLLRNKQGDFFSQFINWVLTIGRLVVIITELIALSAFLYRFSLDRQLIDLRSQIKQKQTIVSSQKANEAKYRNLQDRLYLASNFSSLGMERITTLKDILSLTPQGMKLSTISLTKENFSITTNVQNMSSIRFYANSLKKYPKLDTLNLDSIEKKALSNLTVVNISGTFKKSKYEDVK